MNECSNFKFQLLFIPCVKFLYVSWCLKIKYSWLVIPEQLISWMCTSTVNYARHNCLIANEKLPFICDKSIIASTTYLHQQNPCMTSGIIFVTIPYCTIYYLLLSGISYCMCPSVKYHWISHKLLSLSCS